MPEIQLDRIDRQILALLQQDASLSNVELAERIGLSASPCARRVKLLEEAGIIEGRVTLLNQEAVGLPLTIYIQVSMQTQSTERLENFEQTIASFDAVQECSLVTGSDADYLLKVVMPDMAYYEHFLLKQLNQIDGVASIRTSFALRRVVQRTQQPLDHLR